MLISSFNPFIFEKDLFIYAPDRWTCSVPFDVTVYLYI